MLFLTAVSAGNPAMAIPNAIGSIFFSDRQRHVQETSFCNDNPVCVLFCLCTVFTFFLVMGMCIVDPTWFKKAGKRIKAEKLYEEEQANAARRKKEERIKEIMNKLDDE